MTVLASSWLVFLRLLLDSAIDGAEALHLQSHAAPMPFLPKMGLLTARSLRIAPSKAAEGASRLYFGAQDDREVTIGTDAGGETFAVQRQASAPAMLELDFGTDASKDTLHLASPHINVNYLALRAGLTIKDVHQWQLVRAEDFSQPPVGWNIQAVTSCGGVQMLGGYCKLAGGEVKKTFSGLPPHRQVRVKAAFHFIDRWSGESGYLKLNTAQDVTPTVVWTEMHRQNTESQTAVSMCGSAQVAESKFAAIIDVTVEHTTDIIDMTFGTTLEAEAVDPCEESWGISSVEVYIRN